MPKDIMFLDSIKKMPLMALPVRTPIVQLSEARVMISPGSQLTAEQLASAGEITDVVAPNFLHTAGVSRAKQTFPHANIWAPPKADPAKLSSTNFKNLNDWSYGSELQAIELKGLNRVAEWVFFHKSSRTLLVTDLVFNLTHTSGIGSWIILNMFGTYRRLGVSRFFAKFVSDKEAFRKSLASVMNLDFDNLVMSHGEPVIGGAKAILKRALNERDFGIP